METKICKTCGEEKRAEEFRPQRRECRSCYNNKRKIYRQEHVEDEKIKRRNNYYNNREKRMESSSRSAKKKRLTNPEETRAKARERYRKNKKHICELNRAWQERNKEKFRAIKKEYSMKNKEMQKASAIKHYNKVKNDPKYRINHSMKREMWRLLKINGGAKQGRKWEELVGYTKQELMAHLESQFSDGMTWENYGEWHIDHIIPKCLFNFTDSGQGDFIRCWSLDNLRPFWAKENLHKNRTYNKPFQPSLAL